MPAKTGPSSCSTVLPILPSPSARRVPRCRWLWPISLRTCVIRTFAILGLLWCLRLCLRRLFLQLGRLVRQDLADREPPRLGDLLGATQPSTSSPITTRAVNENRRPPLTTLATRLISTTRSLSSRLSRSSRLITSRSTLVKASVLPRAPLLRAP